MNVFSPEIQIVIGFGFLLVAMLLIAPNMHGSNVKVTVATLLKSEIGITLRDTLIQEIKKSFAEMNCTVPASSVN